MTTKDDPRALVCVDADVLIYAAAPDHPLGQPVRDLVAGAPQIRTCGSVVLLPEVLIKPSRARLAREVEALVAILGQIVLLPATRAVCELSVTLGASYGLGAMDALHLATAVDAGADVFLTNNRRDFAATSITELDVVSPDQLDI